MSNVSAVDQIAQAKAALEKQRAELMRINRDKASQRLAKDRQVSQAKSKADAPNIMGLFLGVRPPRKKTPAEVAAAGQGGSGSGKDAPAAMTVMCSVVKLAEKQIPGLNYRIIDERTIAIPSKSTADISAARKLMDDAKKLPTGTEASTQAIKDAADAMERASRFVDWITITDGEIVTIKTFEQAAANGIGMMQPVQLMGVDANYSVHKGVARSELQCAEPVPLNAKCPAYVSLCNMTDPQQIPMKLPDLSQNYGPTLLFYFADYMRDPSEADRGCVEFKILSNSIERKDYLITSQKKDVPTRSKHVYSMAQNQDGTHPDFPVKGMFGVQALFLEGDAKDTEKITLRRAFGINDPFTYAAIMSANNVPAIISGSVNMKECQKINPGRSHLTDIGTISIWGNSACFLLRQYLLMQCPQVSADWVYRRLKIRSAMGVSGPNVYAKGDDPVVRLERSDPKNVCLLNRDNLLFDKHTATNTLIGEKTINVGEFSGDLQDVIRRSSTPCEFRVMHSSPLDDKARMELAQMPTHLAEKVLSCAEDAPIALVQEGPEKSAGVICVVYLVATLSPEEKQEYLEAEQQWRVRSEASKVAAAARLMAAANQPIPVATDAEGDVFMANAPDGGEGGGDGDDVPATIVDDDANAATVPLTYYPEVPASQEYGNDDDEEAAAQEALRRQVEEELEEKKKAAKKRQLQQQQQEPEASAPTGRSGKKSSRKARNDDE